MSVTLAPDLEAEYWRLYGICACVMLNPTHFKYDHTEDTYDCIEDKHEWHDGADVRRLHELMEMREGAAA